MAKAQRVVHVGQRMVAFLAMLVFTWAVVGCAKPTEPTVLLSEPTAAPHVLAGPMAEVSPPETLDTLKQIIDAYTPQVRILSPRPGEVVESATVSVRFQVRGLPLFKDETWQLGPHLHVFLDDQPYQAVYDASEPLVLEDLAPGTHTLRVFASRPWHESFKNQGAFDQRTFHIFAPTPQNEVNASAPLLTYSRPQGTYGAEPIMLDFYLTNAPLHLSAQADPKDDLHDWRIRCTVNGQSFVFDQWQPIYLKGFQPGRNWVQLELIDETGRPIENRFNNTVRIIDYQPGGTDTLSRLVRGELDLKAVASIIDPTYTPPAPPVSPAVAEDEDSSSQAPKAIGTSQDPQALETPEAIEKTGAAAEPETVEEPPSTAPQPLKPEPLGAAPSPADAAAPEPSQAQDETEVQAEIQAEDSAPAMAAEPEVAAPDSPALTPQAPVEEASPAAPAGDASPDIILPEKAADTQPDTETVTGRNPNPTLGRNPELAPAAENSTENSTENQNDTAVEPIPNSGSSAASPDRFQTQTQDMTQAQTQAQDQVQTQARDQEMTPPESPMARGKGMMKRWKTWAQQQTLPGFGTNQPEAAPELPPISVYETPALIETAPTSPAPSASEDDPSALAAPPRAMPERIEPYLTQSHMTEPRMDRPSSDTDEALDSAEPGAADQDVADNTDGKEALESEVSPQPNPGQANRFKRPYI